MSAVNGSEQFIEVGELVVRPEQLAVAARGRVMPLSRRELDLLLVLAGQTGRVFPREALHRAVWGTPYEKTDRSVDVYVHKLRAKLARISDWQYIHTHFGFGYRFQPERSQDFHNRATTR